MESRLLLSAIVSGQTVFGTIAANGQTVYYDYSATAGQAFDVSLGVPDQTSAFLPEMTVFDPNDHVANNYYPSTPNSHSSVGELVLAALGGMYKILVQSDSPTNTGAYALELAAAPAAQAADADGDGGTITSGQTKNGSINRPGDIDAYSFSATAGQAFEVSLGVPDQTSAFLPDMTVFDPSGHVANNYYPSTPNSHSSVGELVLAALGGTYTILVQSDSPTNTGAYAVELAAAPAAQAADADGDGGAITSGQTKNGSINRPGDIDTYSFSATAGQAFEVSLGVTDQTSAFLPDLAIFDPNGHVANNDYPNTANSHSSVDELVVAAVGGTYTILVQSDSSFNTGAYALELAAAPAAQAADADGDGGALLSGHRVGGAIERPGDLDVFTFTASAGDAFSVSASGGAGSGYEPQMEIFDPLGHFVALGSNPNTNSTATTSYSVPSGSGGTYTVVVESDSPSSTGGYSVGVVGNILLSLANLCSDVYSSTPSGYAAQGFFPVLTSYDPSDAGYAAAAYSDLDATQVVVAVRGSVFDFSQPIEFLKSVAADVSFDASNSVPTIELQNQVADAASFVASVRAAYPNATLIVTGHSLGGAIAQLIGEASGLFTETFNAPGAAQLYKNLSSELKPVSSLTGPDVNINYRLQGDQVSLFGKPIQTVIKLAAPQPGFVSLNPVTQLIATLQQYGNLHSIITFIQEIQNNAPFDTVSGDESNYAALLQAITVPSLIIGNGGYKAYSFLFTVSNLVGLIDPGTGNDFVFSGSAGSPPLVSIELPDVAGVSAFEVRYQSGSNWSAYTTVLAGVTDQFGASATSVEFRPLNTAMAVMTITDSFIFAPGFASSGTFSGTLSESTWLAQGSKATWNASTNTLTISGPTTITSDPGTDEPDIVANGSAAQISFNAPAGTQFHIGGLTLTGGASATVTSPGMPRTNSNYNLLIVGIPGASVAPTLSIDSTSRLDLSDNDMVVVSGSLSAVSSRIAHGYNAAAGGNWAGLGITSSAAASDITHLTSLGIMQNNQSGTALFNSVNPFDGTVPGAADLLVRYTYYGDANLDGKVDGSDYSRIDNGALNHLTGWFNGDFNFDGVTNADDYTLIDNASNTQRGGLSFTGLSVAAGSVTTLPISSFGPIVRVTQGLNIAGSTGAWTGQLDITNNDIDIVTGSLAAVTSQIKSGYGGGTWLGLGITSSTAANDNTHLTAVGLVQNNQSGSALFTSAHTLDGTVPGASDILVKYTYYGDTNLDGKVDGSDYSRIDNGSLNHLTGWFNGDFNYDGVIDGSDYTLIDNAYNTQGPSLAAEIASSVAASNTASPPARRASVFAPRPAAYAAGAVSSGTPLFSQGVAAGIFGNDGGDLLTRKKSRRS